jgi:hypothetical protein
MSSADHSNPSTASNTTATPPVAAENDLDNLVAQLRQTINKSDWLSQNTSTKWEAENPDLAKQWREAIKPKDSAPS